MSISGVVVQNSALETCAMLEDNSIGAIISDPPFFISTGRDGGGFGDDPWATDLSTLTAITDYLMPHMEEFKRVVRPGGAIVLLAGGHASSCWYRVAEAANLKWMAENLILWNTGKPRQRNFGSLHTLALWWAVRGQKHSFNLDSGKAIYSNVMVAKKVPIGAREHISQKPVCLTNFYVSLLTDEDDIVFDPFCGSGSTLVSAELCGRQWLGCDLNANNVEVASHRAATADMQDVGELKLWVNGKVHAVA